MSFNTKTPMVLAFVCSTFLTNTYAMRMNDATRFYGDTNTELKSITVQNPCYLEKKTPREFQVFNGDTLLFSDTGVIGEAIRGAQSINATYNPNGITHSEIVVLDYANTMLEYVKSINFNTKDEEILLVNQKAQQQAIEHIESNCYDILAMPRDSVLTPFCFGATGTASEVLKGIWPHVHITCLDAQLKEYGGNVYIRNLLEKYYIPQDITRNYISNNLFRTYETISTLDSLLKATKDGNEEAASDSDRLFCSELVADFYKYACILPSSVVSCNVVPEDLSSGAREYDLLSCIAYDDLMLKYTKTLSKKSIDGNTFFGRIARWFTNLFH